MHRIRHGTVMDGDWAKLAHSSGRLHQMPIWLVDRVVSTDEVSSITRQHALREGLDLLCVDYMQLVRTETKHGGNREREVAAIGRCLKELAMELQIPVVGLSQINRSSASRDNPRPMLSDLRESGALEQEASIVIATYFDKAAAEEVQADEDIDAEFLVLKNRNGPTGMVKMLWQKRYARFRDAA